MVFEEPFGEEVHNNDKCLFGGVVVCEDLKGEFELIENSEL